VQLIRVDTDMQSKQDDPIHGYNLRFGATLHLLKERLHPFANFSMAQNEVLGGMGDTKKLTGEVYTGYTASGASTSTTSASTASASSTAS